MKQFLLFVFATCSFLYSYSQVKLQGRIFDASTRETVIGARVVVEGTTKGALTDWDGRFDLELDEDLPISLKVESAGFRTKTLEITDTTNFKTLHLMPQQPLANAVVISASRVEERILEAPVSIHRLEVLDMRYKAAAQVHGSLSTLPGVMVNTSSLLFQSPNTRGFGNVQNWRFLQLIDGMDISGPGINYAVGNALIGSELDVRSVEVVPGPGSALYGANAFNGLMSTQTKSPWDYPGLSAYLRQGFMSSQDQTQTPISSVGLRFAKVFNDQWAVKVNVTYLGGSEWQANDASQLITHENASRQAELLDRDPFHPNYDAVNVYGDEAQALVDLEGNGALTPINRSGIPEAELLDPKVQQVGVQASLHYRISPDVEANYDFRYAKSDAIIRSNDFYPFQDYQTHYHKLELKGDNFFVRAYHGQDNPGDGYSLLRAGAVIQETQKPGTEWGNDYGTAYRGEVPGIAGGSHRAAREFADRGVSDGPFRGTPAILNWTRSLPLDFPAGSAVVYESSISQVEANYQLSEQIEWMNVQVGGNLRRHLLSSQGHVYNDGVTGFNAAIPVVEMGVYVQADRWLWNERLHLRGSLRYDKHQEFQGRVSPRASVVANLGASRQHKIRASVQSGFRNPANQDLYVAFEEGQSVYLGNARRNVENYQYKLGDEQILTGEEIYESLVTQASYQAFLAAGGDDASLLQPANLSFLRQEQITSVEVGYRTLLFKKVYFDASGYYNWYQDFTTTQLSMSPQAGLPFLTLVNVPQTVYAWGSTLGLDAALPGDFHLKGSYTYSGFDADAATSANENYHPGFNFPEHMAKVSLGNQNLIADLGFQLDYRWLSSYTFHAPAIQTEIPDRQVVDAAIFYHLRPAKCLVKFGATNLFNEAYTPIYGGPTVGATYYFQVTFDELFN